MTAFIRRVEAPLILERAKQHGEQDGFFLIPVLAGGLDYGQVGDVLGEWEKTGAENAPEHAI